MITAVPLGCAFVTWFSGSYRTHIPPAASLLSSLTASDPSNVIIKYHYVPPNGKYLFYKLFSAIRNGYQAFRQIKVRDGHALRSLPSSPAITV